MVLGTDRLSFAGLVGNVRGNRGVVGLGANVLYGAAQAVNTRFNRH